MDSAYHVNGFQIISVSIDYTFDEWQQGSDEHQLPWYYLADIGGFAEKTPTSYGVESIPTKYLIDSNGCIVGKYLDTDHIEE